MEQLKQLENRNESGFYFHKACERARKHGEDQSTKEIKNKRRGLEFMALRLDVAEKHFELSIQKKITPAEDNLIKLISIGTIGSQNARRQICSKTIFDISVVSSKLGYKEKDKIWKILKSLEKKGYITREKTKNKDQEILGLNPKVFGQILNDQQDEKERRRHLSLVPNQDQNERDACVDNSPKEPDQFPTQCPRSTDTVSVDHRQNIGEVPTDRRESSSQDSEIIRENLSLYSSRFILDSLRWQKGAEETKVSWMGSGTNNRRTAEEHLRIVMSQLEEMKKCQK